MSQNRKDKKRRRRVRSRRSAAALTAALLVAPAGAAAQPIEAAGLPDGPVASGPALAPVEVSDEDGFDWGDAAIGAGVVAGAIAVGLASGRGTRRLRASSERRGLSAAGSS